MYHLLLLMGKKSICCINSADFGCSASKPPHGGAVGPREGSDFRDCGLFKKKKKKRWWFTEEWVHEVDFKEGKQKKKHPDKLKSSLTNSEWSSEPSCKKKKNNKKVNRQVRHWSFRKESLVVSAVSSWSSPTFYGWVRAAGLLGGASHVTDR